MSETEIPDDAVRRKGMPVKLPGHDEEDVDPEDGRCQVCGSEPFHFEWQMVHGSANCLDCGANYQLKPTTESSWDEMPRLDVKEDFIEPVAQFHIESGLNANRNQERFVAFLEDNYPKLADSING